MWNKVPEVTNLAKCWIPVADGETLFDPFQPVTTPLCTATSMTTPPISTTERQASAAHADPTGTHPPAWAALVGEPQGHR